MTTDIAIEPLEIKAGELKKAALFFRAINHKLRRQILGVLHRQGSMTVTEIYVALTLEQAVASQHLAVLRKASLVHTKRDGKRIFYSVNYEQLKQLHEIAGQLLHDTDL